jgi:hypothetical protein
MGPRGIAYGAAAGLLLLAASAATAEDPLLKGFHRVASVEVPLDGREVTLPLPRGARRDGVRVVIEGSFQCSYNGRTYYSRGNSGDQTSAVSYVMPDPPKGWLPVSVGGWDVRSERVVLMANRSQSLPETVGAYVDIDQLVRELIVTPSEVRRSLSGSVRLEVWQRQPLPVMPLALAGGLLVVLIGVTVIRAQASRKAAMADAEATLRRIESKYGPAVKAIDDRRRDAPELRSELTRLRDGARELVARVAAFRRAAASADRGNLQAEIARNEELLASANRDDVGAEAEATLASQRRLRDLLVDTRANEARYLLRLSRVESALDAAALWITGQQAALADEGADHKAIQALHEELESLDRAIEELRVVPQ